LLLACKGVCFEESCGEWFRHYTSSVVRNARSLASALINNGMHVVTGGTDTHIVICDLRPLGISGADLERALHGLRIMTNRNLIPGDQRGPGIASGIRLGTAFVTSRGFDEADCAALGSAISRIACDLSAGGLVATARALQVNDLVRQLNETKPVPSVLFQ
jgi:glycine hydroxymethyltransferase